MESENDSYQIDDLGEAITLLTVGFNLLKMEPSNNGKFKIFFFEKKHPATNATIDGTLGNYQRYRLSVDAHSFYRSMKEIKHRIYEFNQRADAKIN